MGSPFDAHARAADAVQTRVFGEPVRIEPQATHRNFGTIGADVIRQAACVTGIFTKAPATEPLEGSRRGADGRGTTRFAGFGTQLWLAAATRAGLGYELRADDVIVLTDRGNERWSIVKAGPPTDIGDITLILAIDGSAA